MEECQFQKMGAEHMQMQLINFQLNGNWQWRTRETRRSERTWQNHSIRKLNFNFDPNKREKIKCLNGLGLSALSSESQFLPFSSKSNT